MKRSSAFTLLEILIVIVIIGILAIIAIPKFISMRTDAINAAAQANLAALNSAVSAYYANSAAHNYLCTTANPFRSVNAPGSDVGTPCYPVNVKELESLLVSNTSWSDNGGGYCYNSTTDANVACPPVP